MQHGWRTWYEAGTKPVTRLPALTPLGQMLSSKKSLLRRCIPTAKQNKKKAVSKVEKEGLRADIF